MSGQKRKQAFDAGRQNMWMFDPGKLVIVEDKADPLYDPRIENPVPSGMTKSILRRGVIQPVSIVKRGGQPIVVDGRQRVRCAREANAIDLERGGPGIKVPCVLKHADDRDLMGMMIAANEIRKDDTPIEKAKKAQKLMTRGFIEDEIAELFGVTKQTITNWTRLLEADPEVLKAVKDGALTATKAVTLSKQPAPEQKAAAKAAKEGKAVEAAEREKRPRMRNRAEIAKKLEEDGLSSEFAAALRWALRLD